ncbi:hypothetical protein ART_1659 [Arthrobacter sp. PAMC 25486]|uniref:hypothetical protein n=1 Tax=Arthrobacter sp. PAMC 25486 TaxID=1494608 RepID=UPI000535FA7C|nr:hypothetical protein [Arthrobacter sp. PAMC 25486]AIY01258.1 hypothetical protein ART_1659 [Arthrobacter sp. PAMC 25486]
MKRQFLAILLGTGLALTACTGVPDSGVESSNPPPATSEQPQPGDKPTAAEPTLSPAPGREMLLRDVKCTADESGSWSFDGYLVNDQEQQRTFTIAIAVTVGMEVKGHDMVIQEVPGKGEFHVTRNYFAQAADEGAVCEPVVSVEG